MGRPSDYTDEMATTICARLAEGEPLVRMCKEDGMPSVVSVYRWLAAHDEFRNRYARARDDQADTLADEIITVADDSKLEADDKRVRIDARKWVASKLKPKKYGDKIGIGAAEGLAPLAITATDERG
jgi:hypothetical protein